MNRLAAESSPYLRQHATNPVDWYPWGNEAFELARREDKPVFVSIGYASCHWCHVMAHESFEDEEVAADLGSSFVSVKVDREERPDVDAIYMAAVQAMTGAGGWPMSVWCTPDGRPFFAGTYFPPADRHGLPAFRKVIGALSSAWRERRTEVEAQADALAEALQREASFLDRPPAGSPDVSADSIGAPPPAPVAVPASPVPQFDAVLGKLVAALGERFDPAWGGFGPAPKFPRPGLLELCLRHHGMVGDPASLAMATATLDAMATGGIYDHLAGGFARYSTDRQWLVPHFEKMLTDQALLARAYLHAWQATGSDDYRQVATETLDWVCDELSAPSGGLCSSVDADAGGVEGGHATWTPAEVTSALTDAGMADLAPVVCDWYGVTGDGNWEGRTVLRRPLRASLRRPPEIESARRALLAARRKRPQPSRDDKVLTEWNAMFIAVLAEAAAACDERRWAERAEAEAAALFTRNRRRDGRWLRSAENAAVGGFAADYAWVVECCTRLCELTGRAVWVERAAETAGAMLDLFWDSQRGGFFTTGRDAERLIVRTKDVLDSAVPSAASAASQALLRLAALTGEARWRSAGERLIELVTPLLEEQPFAVADMVGALALAEGGAEVVVTGDRPELVAATRQRWLPDTVVAWGEPTGPALWEGRANGAAYVCRRFTCREPAYEVEVLERQLLPLSVAAPQ